MIYRSRLIKPVQAANLSKKPAQKKNMQGSDHFHKDIQNLCRRGLGS